MNPNASDLEMLPRDAVACKGARRNSGIVSSAFPWGSMICLSLGVDDLGSMICLSLGVDDLGSGWLCRRKQTSFSRRKLVFSRTNKDVSGLLCRRKPTSRTLHSHSKQRNCEDSLATGAPQNNAGQCHNFPRSPTPNGFKPFPGTFCRRLMQPLPLHSNP